MKRIMTLLLVFVMVVSLGACGVQSKTEPSPNPSTTANTEAAADGSESESESAIVETSSDAEAVDTQEQQGGEVDIEVSPPAGWEPIAGSVIPVQQMKNTASFMVKPENYSGETLDDVADEALEIFKGTFDNVSVIGDVETLTVDGKDARTFTFTCTVSKLDMKFQYVFIFVADKTYVITFGDMADTFDSLSADYEEILNNIKFTVS